MLNYNLFFFNIFQSTIYSMMLPQHSGMFITTTFGLTATNKITYHGFLHNISGRP